MLTRKTPQILLIALATAVAALILWFEPQIGFMRPLLSLFLIVILGHSALLAWGAGLRLRGAVWGLMTIILGIAIVTIGGIVLNFTPWGLQLHSWIVFITGVIVIQLLVALIRRTTEPSTVPSTSIHSWHFEMKPMQFVALFLAVTIVGVSIIVARTGVVNQPKTSFSQLWMVADASNQVNLGIKNEEQEAVSYRLVVQQGSSVIYEYPSLLLQAHETWQGVLEIEESRPTDVPIEAVLYRADEPNQAYRTVSLWLE